MTILYAALTLLALLTIKHFVADFPLQTPYQYLNKGNYGHPGGILHSAIHAGFTAIAVIITLVIFGLPSAAFTSLMIFNSVLVDFLVHYHCDWAKVQITHKYGWASAGVDENGKKCLRIYDNKYFIALGADQLVHGLTYVAILGINVFTLIILGVI